MILTDYFRAKHDLTWDLALQCGVTGGTIRVPEEDPDFDLTDFSCWEKMYGEFTSAGITPTVVEPLPNCLHDHIKAGDELRDESIEKLIKMLSIMDRLNIRILCFNFMAHIGWLRTNNAIKERGNALVTGFDIKEFTPKDVSITEEQLWDNYTYFLKAVIPYAEKYNIKLALHPDDPPRAKLGDVSRIMISYKNIDRAINGIVKSDCLGVTMCQATYHMMGEDLFEVIPKLKDKIFFIHFRNTTGNKDCFRETFHDNGELDMAALMRLYTDLKIDVPIRVDHVPLMAGEGESNSGYTAIGRLFAIGYLKGILEGLSK